MPKTTYIVPEVPGAQRVSERPYTHVVIGRHNMAAHRAARSHPGLQREIRSTWEFNRDMAAAAVGEVPAVPGWQWAITQKDHDRYAGYMAEHPTLEGYVAYRDALTEKYLADLEAQGTLVVQWSMSEKNAIAGANTSSRRELLVDLRVVHCIPKPKAVRAKKAA